MPDVCIGGFPDAAAAPGGHTRVLDCVFLNGIRVNHHTDDLKTKAGRAGQRDIKIHTPSLRFAFDKCIAFDYCHQAAAESFVQCEQP